MALWKRTHRCNAVGVEHVGHEVILNGWVSHCRDFGGMLFIIIQDRWGEIQIIFSVEDETLLQKAQRLRNGWVIGIKGVVQKRSEKAINKKMKTGYIEINAIQLNIYNTTTDLPFESHDNILANDDTRQRYRYLDLRRPIMQKTLISRSKLCHSIRSFLMDNAFVEIETPILTKSTPEGARDFLVPSRINKGCFYALPQSPQIYKQILMVSGFERYFQIARCFRDEDLRADRQPEFTQLDIECSFIDEHDIYAMIEKLMFHVWYEMKGVKLELPFERISYTNAIKQYGSDKPDLRYELHLKDVTAAWQKTTFPPILKQIDDNQKMVAFCVNDVSKLSRKQLDKILDEAKKLYNMEGIIYLQYHDDNIKMNISNKYVNPRVQQDIIKTCRVQKNGLCFMSCGHEDDIYMKMGELRIHVAKALDIIPNNKYKFVWVNDFPLLKWNTEEKAYSPMHHPFTSPKENYISKLESSPSEIIAQAYDLTLNGHEIGGGSIRIHNSELQKQIFKLCKLTDDEINKKFGFLLEALQSGAPPHGGIAFGLDRIAMILMDTKNLRDVIAFPKNQKAQSIMDGSPTSVDKEQLEQLCISVTKAQNQTEHT